MVLLPFCLIFWIYFRRSFFFPLPFVLFSCDLISNFSVVWVAVPFLLSTVELQFAFTMMLWYSILYIYIVLSSWFLNFKIHFPYCTLEVSLFLAIAAFGIILVCGWLPSFTVCLVLLMSVSINNFLVYSCGHLFFI